MYFFLVSDRKLFLTFLPGSKGEDFPCCRCYNLFHRFASYPSSNFCRKYPNFMSPSVKSSGASNNLVLLAFECYNGWNLILFKFQISYIIDRHIFYPSFFNFKIKLTWIIFWLSHRNSIFTWCSMRIGNSLLRKLRHIVIFIMSGRLTLMSITQHAWTRNIFCDL